MNSDKALDIVYKYIEEHFGIPSENLEFPDIELLEVRVFDTGAHYLIRAVVDGVRYFNIISDDSCWSIEVYSIEDRFEVKDEQ